ncbi:CCHC-type domain-containing protein [Trichonephila clavipes]|nr:CCHC-type domain-containing protein [Trichonephila clavipes]
MEGLPYCNLYRSKFGDKKIWRPKVGPPRIQPLGALRKKIFKKPGRKCYVCRKPGHLAKDCWKKESKPKVDGDAFVCTVESVPESEMWIADSRASAHMTKYKNYFVNFTQFNSSKTVYLGNSDAILAYGHGSVNIEQ